MGIKIFVDKMDQGVIIKLIGRLDTFTYEEAEKEILKNIDKNTLVSLDFQEVTYISSEGLRALLKAQKRANDLRVEMALENVGEGVMKNFRMTGFVNFLTIIDGSKYE